MASEGVSLSAALVVEDVLKQQGSRPRNIDLASRKEEEAAIRRYEAAGWLRRMVGVVGARDLPEEPTEEEFRVGLRNGIVLCNVLNKVQPGAVPKVVEAPPDSALLPDPAALSAYQYFENLRNFLVAMEELGLPTFEASDLERGGKGSRVVNSVLALKSYGENKGIGRTGSGSSKYGGILKPSSSGKCFMRRNSEPFMNSLSRSLSADKMQDALLVDQNLSLYFLTESTEMTISPSLSMLVRTILSDKKPEEVPLLVESMLSRVMQEFEHRLASQNELVKTTSKDLTDGTKSSSEANNLTEISSTCDEKVKTTLKDLTDGTESFSEANKLTEISSPCEEKVKTTLKDLTEGTKSFCETSNLTEIPSTCEEKVKPILKDLTDETKSCEANNLTEISSTCEEKTVKAENTFISSKSKVEDFSMRLQKEEAFKQKHKEKLLKQGLLFDRQKREIEELKDTLLTTRAGVQLMRTKYSEEFNNLGKRMQILAHAASGYHKILGENRKLYNQLQDLKGSIRVYCRVRPFLPGQTSMSTVGHIDYGSITILTPSKYGKEGHKSFNFNRCFSPSATQAEVFSDTQPLIRSVLDGYNVCIFAYGQTGSGKTYTMSGPKVLNEEGYGVNYRALNDLFNISQQRKDTVCYEISVQMIEIYNEQVRDLLNSDGHQKRLDIRNNSQNGIAVPDANLIPVASTEEVVELMNIGQRNRVVSATAMNDRSSRSHSCLTIHVQGRELTSGAVLRGCMHLVDLAGSERVNKSEVKGDRLKEAAHINKSLAALGDVISALAQKNAHVPYRNSKLTQLLQDSLGGQAKTLMFVHISPEADALSETISTLKFAERVATIELGAAQVNKDGGEVKELKQQIASLRAALAKKENEPFRSTMSSPDICSIKSGATSPAHPNQMQTEDFGNIEISSSLVQDRADDDLQDFVTTSVSSSWTEGYLGNKVMGPGEWVNKVKHENALGDWEGENLHVPEPLYQGYIPDVRVFRDHHRSQAHSIAATDDSDDLDNATSDSSEPDMIVNPPKTSIAVNGVSKLKRPQSGPLKSSDTRMPSRIHVPSASRKTANAPSAQTGNRTTKQTGSASVDVKRRQNGKTTGGK